MRNIIYPFLLALLVASCTSEGDALTVEKENSTIVTVEPDM
jgi:hypothetical protein